MSIDLSPAALGLTIIDLHSAFEIADQDMARMLAMVRLQHVCSAGDDSSAQIDGALQHLPTLISRALFALRIMPCAVGQDREDLVNLGERVVESAPERPKREMLALEKTILAARQGSADEALRHLKDAQRLPWAIDALANRGEDAGREAVRRPAPSQ